VPSGKEQHDIAGGPSPARRAISAQTERRRPISGIQTSSLSVRSSIDMRSRIVQSRACGPAPSGERARLGALRAAIWSGATSPTTASCAGSKLFIDFMVDGVKCGPDGARCDVDGNLWCSSNAGRAVGYSGVTVWTPEGKPQTQPAVHGREPTQSTSTHKGRPRDNLPRNYRSGGGVVDQRHHCSRLGHG